MTNHEGLRAAENHIFDESFTATSANIDGQGRLQSISLLLSRDERKYVLDVETYGIHVSRLDPDSAEADEDTAYVVAADEIMPSELIHIKGMPTEQLTPYLVEQDVE